MMPSLVAGSAFLAAAESIAGSNERMKEEMEKMAKEEEQKNLNELVIKLEPHLYENDKVWRTPTRPVRAEPKQSRNSLCWCGSGRKYKRCCLLRESK